MLSCSPHSPQEIRKRNVRTDMTEKKYDGSPVLSFHRGLVSLTKMRCACCPSYHSNRRCLSILIKSNLKVSEHQKTLSLFFKKPDLMLFHFQSLREGKGRNNTSNTCFCFGSGFNEICSCEEVTTRARG